MIRLSLEEDRSSITESQYVVFSTFIDMCSLKKFDLMKYGEQGGGCHGSTALNWNQEKGLVYLKYNLVSAIITGCLEYTCWFWQVKGSKSL